MYDGFTVLFDVCLCLPFLSSLFFPPPSPSLPLSPHFPAPPSLSPSLLPSPLLPLSPSLCSVLSETDDVVHPLLFAAETKNPRIVQLSLTSLQKLMQYKAIPQVSSTLFHLYPHPPTPSESLSRIYSVTPSFSHLSRLPSLPVPHSL